MCIYIYIYKYVCTSIYIYIYICIHIHTLTGVRHGTRPDAEDAAAFRRKHDWKLRVQGPC